MKLKAYIKVVVIIVLLLHITLLLNAQHLANEFQHPPSDSKVLNWWHWMGGNVTKTGIEKDLVAMKNAGVGGAILFNIGSSPSGDVPFFSNVWWEHVGFAIKKADSLGLKFGAFNSDGFSMSGGPWIDVEESMKILVNEEITIDGGKPIALKLPVPKHNIIYHDVAIIAYPTLEKEQPVKFTIKSAQNVQNEAFLIDGDKETQTIFSNNTTEAASVVFDFGAEVAIRRLVADKVSVWAFAPGYLKVEYSDDGQNYTLIDANFPLNFIFESDIKSVTLSFPEVNTRYIRISPIFLDPSGLNKLIQKHIKIGSIQFFNTARVGLWEQKSGQSKKIDHIAQAEFQKELTSSTNDKLLKGSFIPADKIINISDKLDSNGTINWDAPKGKWTIMRLGYTSTLRMNSPASDTGKGYESDKMSAAATRKHFNGYVSKVNDLSLKLVGKPIDFMQMESWEAGIQNWTAGFDSLFEARNGYSLIPWLPVMSEGYVVNSYDESNRFLWDLRKTISELMAENYWAVMHKLSKDKGIQVLGEGSGRQHYLYDPIAYHKHTDIPMGEFWTNEGIPRADCKNAASVAHTYGKKLVAAEAFTGDGAELWRHTPFDFKEIGDEAFTYGVNQFVLHSYVHQPYEMGPGFTLGRFGNHFQRHNVWYNYADGWMNYLARCQYMLRQGELVTDVCYFTGEGIPGYLGSRSELRPVFPYGYDYDGVNLELVKQMKVLNAKLVLPSGAAFHLMVFPRILKMTPELIVEVKRLVEAGGTIVSPKPSGSYSLVDYPACDKIVKDIADELWGDIDGITIQQKNFGKGKVVWGISIEQLLDEKKVVPDFSYSGTESALNYTHRKSGDIDIYFVASKQNTASEVNCLFRSENTPEIWDADKGSQVYVPFTRVGSQTKIDLSFDPLGSYFVVFQPKSKLVAAAKNKTLKEIELNTAWQLNFPKGSGAPEYIVYNTLQDWTVSENDGIKYFSGTVTYNNSFEIKNTKDKSIMLDLGMVNNIVVVYINDIKVANLWKPPYKVAITNQVLKGSNKITLEVTNSSANRIIGDEQLPADVEYGKSNMGAVKQLPVWLTGPEKRESGRKTFVSYQCFTAKDRLEPSGLLGPVKIIVYK